MTKTVLLDCDDVLLNWLEGFAEYVSAEIGREPNPRGPDNWSMDKWLGIEPHEVADYIEAFNASPAFGELNAVGGAVFAVHDLLASFDDVRLHVITSCSSDWDTVEMRKRNLKRVYGAWVFDSVHCLDLGQSKEPILHAFEPCIWIEDNFKNALMGVKAGHKTLMRQTSHNIRHRAEAEAAGIKWFTDWHDFLNLTETF